MMNIPAENIFELKEASKIDLDEICKKVFTRARPLAEKLYNSTGIIGNSEY